MVKVKYKKLSPDVVMPTQPIPGNSGWDIRAEKRVIINPYKTVRVGTGLAVELPKGYEIQVRGRSSVAMEKGITISQGVGTIDHGYTGEVQVFLRNMEPFTKLFEPGEIIAQLFIKEVPEVEWEESNKIGIPIRKKKEVEVKKEEVKKE